MSLKEILAETAAKAGDKFPPEIMAIMKKASADLEAQGVGNEALKAGDALPDATLTDATGQSVSLSSLLAKGPLILNFYRGSWCPYCNMELKAYQDLLSEIQDAGGQLAAITPEKPDGSLSTVEKHALKFPVLTDAGNDFAKSLGIAFELPTELQALYGKFGMDLPSINAGTGWTLAIPATYVVASDGKIVLAHVERDYTTRLEPSEAVAALKAVAPVAS